MLALWMGLSALGTLRVVHSPGTPAVTAELEALETRAALIDMVLGGDRICGGEEDPESAVFCGGELLASLLVDPSLLVMSRSTCSLLLERLYASETCSLAEGGCRAWPVRPAPTSPRLSVPPMAVALHGKIDFFLFAQARARMRGDGDSEPDTWQAQPPSPPPRPLATA